MTEITNWPRFIACIVSFVCWFILMIAFYWSCHDKKNPITNVVSK